MRTSIFIMLTVMAFAISSCVINLPLIPKQAPLEEQVIEGNGDNKIALLDISGFISSEPRSRSLGPDLPSMPGELRESLALATYDEDVRGIILKINSPGGTVAASDMLHHELTSFKTATQKPVYAVITGLGTSGAYYTASAADRIWAHPTAVTGSIGVLIMNVEASGLMEKLGVRNKTIKSGDKKDIFSPLRPDTPEEEEIMQDIVDDMYARFLDVVEAGRTGKLSRQEIEELADGRPYSAAQALDVGLIDNIGYIDEAIETLKQDIGLTRAQVITYVRPGGYKSTIYAAPPGGVSINVLNLGPGMLGNEPGVKFLYLWSPEL